MLESLAQLSGPVWSYLIGKLESAWGQKSPEPQHSHCRGRRFKPCTAHQQNQRLTALSGAVCASGARKVPETGVAEPPVRRLHRRRRRAARCSPRRPSAACATSRLAGWKCRWRPRRPRRQLPPVCGNWISQARERACPTKPRTRTVRRLGWRWRARRPSSRAGERRADEPRRYGARRRCSSAAGGSGCSADWRRELGRLRWFLAVDVDAVAAAVRRLRLDRRHSAVHEAFIGFAGLAQHVAHVAQRLIKVSGQCAQPLPVPALEGVLRRGCLTGR